MIIILSGRDVAQGCMLRAISSLGGWVYVSNSDNDGGWYCLVVARDGCFWSMTVF